MSVISQDNWGEESSTTHGANWPSHVACDVGYQNVRNWLRTPFIPVDNAKQYQLSCKETFTLFKYEADYDFANDTVPAWTVQSFNTIGIISPEAYDVEQVKVMEVAVDKKGLYFVFLDEGSCTQLVAVKVFAEVDSVSETVTEPAVHSLTTSSASDVLLDSTSQGDLKLWGWKKNTENGRQIEDGWVEESYFPSPNSGPGWRSYFTCDIRRQNVRNWLRTPFIPVDNAKQVSIEMTFVIRNCTYQRSCKVTFTLLKYEADYDFANDTVPAWTVQSFNTIGIISPEAYDVEQVKVMEVAVDKKGLYFVFLDEGSCTQLVAVKVFAEVDSVSETVTEPAVHSLTTSSASDVLLDSTSQGDLKLWGWKKNTENGRQIEDGWVEESYFPSPNSGPGWRSYLTCDIWRQNVRNWLRTPFIPVDNAKQTFRITSEQRRSCKETFTLLKYEADYDFANDTMPAWTVQSFSTIGRISPEAYGVEQVKVMEVDVDKRGLYFVFLDEGSCTKLVAVKVKKGEAEV